MPQFQTQEHDALGGIQTSKPLTKFSEDDAFIAIGGHFDLVASFDKRRGGSKYNFTSLNSHGNGIFDFRFNNNTNQKLLLFGKNTVYEGNGGVPVAILTGQSDSRYTALKFNIGGKDFAFWTNGVDPMRKYDGTTVTFASISAPSNTMVATPAVGGTLANGTYLLAVTFLNADDEESNPSAFVSVTLAGANNQINLSVIPVSPDPQVTKRRIYMSAAGGAVLFANTDINDNVTTTVSIKNDSTGLELEFNHDVSPIAQYLVPYNNRMAAAGDPNAPDILYLSKDFEAWYWPQGIGSSTDFRIKIGNGEPIRGLASFHETLLVATEEDIYVVSGIPDDGSIRVDKVKADERAGTVSHWSMQVIEGWCWYVGRTSVYRTNGFEIQDVGWSLSGFFNPGATDSRFNINSSFLKNCTSITVKTKPHHWYIFSTATSFEINNNTSFMIDYSSVRPDEMAGRIKTSCAVWPGFFNQASAIVIQSGVERWYRWDDLGFIFVMDTIDGDGAQVTSISTGGNTANTLNDTTQAWTPNAFVGLYATHISDTTTPIPIGSEDVRRIVSNTATQITINGVWTQIPSATSRYAIGGIEYDYAAKWDAYGNKNLSKRWRYVRPRFETDGTFPVNLIFGFDFNLLDAFIEVFTFTGGSFWDVDLWDVGIWDFAAILDRLIGLPGDRIHRWSLFRVRNLGAGEHFTLAGFDKVFQMKGMRPDLGGSS